MIEEYSQEVFEHAKMLKCRFALLSLRDQCRSKGSVFDDDGWKWRSLSRRFSIILVEYDDGVKLNQDFLLKLYHVEIDNLTLTFMKRFIKLIKIVSTE